jgi:hypothetical protein
MTDIRYIAFISPALHATLLAWKSEPKPTRKTAQRRRLDSIEKRLAKEQDDREEAFQRRVDAISDAIYQPFQSRERCVLDTAPILSDEQRRVYALQADFKSVGTASRRKLKRELKQMRRKQLAGVLES